jgi:LPXTG-motif cell wall-anchored protein
MMRRTGIAAAASFGGAGLAVIVLALPSAAQPGDPPGNNGTVKIDGVEFDDHPNNEPHVGCTFQVDFYGFDEGDLDASVKFEPWEPTPGAELVTDDLDIGEDPAGGGTDLDASATYDLTSGLAGIEPHPEQGWHVKLTVHADGSQGADTKFKVFWVSGCETPGSTTTTSTTEKPPHNGSTTTTTEKPGNGHHGTSTTTAPSSDGGNGAPGGPQPGAPDGGAGGSSSSGDLPKTGSNSSIPLTIAALVLVSLGATIALWARKIRPEPEHLK